MNRHSNTKLRLTPAPGDSGEAADGMPPLLPGCAIVAESSDCLLLRLSQSVRHSPQVDNKSSYGKIIMSH